MVKQEEEIVISFKQRLNEVFARKEEQKEIG